jgi:ammonium transporter, Amt family
VVFAVPLLDKLKIDDVVGAIPVHLLAGIWGTLVVPLSNGDASFSVQIIGIVAIGAFAVVASFIVWTILKFIMGVRVSEEEERLGLDVVEIGVEAYPEFGAAPSAELPKPIRVGMAGCRRDSGARFAGPFFRAPAAAEPMHG